MEAWAEFISAFMLFLAAHAIPARPTMRRRIEALLGRKGYIVAFSALSLGLLYWLILAAGRAPYIEIWGQPGWSRWLVNLTMPLAVLLWVFAVGTPNPFAFGGRRDGFDPDHPGIAGVTRQPLMMGFAIWAGAHLTANGDLAHVILFGLMLGFALTGVFAAEARAKRALGPDWGRLAARTSLWPFSALLGARWRPSALPDLRRVAIAVLIWAALYRLHAPLIGLSPVP